jgi:hypothetical protein
MPGNILSFQIFGQVIVVLNSAEAAKDLLEKRSAIYSDRPALPILEMCVLQYFTHRVLAHNNQDGMGVDPANGNIKQQLLAPRTQDA